MNYMDWRPGTKLLPPVYVDANILVGAVVANHRLYKTCVNLLGDLLVNQTHILVSTLSVNESLWALVRLSYCELAKQKPNAHFNQKIYENWCDRIFQAYGDRIGTITRMIQGWAKAGVPVEVVPKDEAKWHHVLTLAPEYMRECKLTPGDALHIALAETHAQTFITADSDFGRAQAKKTSSNLLVLHINN